MNKIIQGNILDIQSGIIAHQVNCRRVAGAGLALQIRRKWPAWYDEFLRQEPYLGCVWWYCTAQKGGNPIGCSSPHVASMYAQKNYGRGQQTDYIHFTNCLTKIKLYANKDHPLYIPYGIGCGLGGGDWSIVSRIIEIMVPDAILVEL